MSDTILDFGLLAATTDVRPRTSLVFRPRPDLLVAPNTPKPLHEVTPRNIMGQAWWDVQRKKAYYKHGLQCWTCGGMAEDDGHLHRLEAHEVYNVDYARGRMTFVEVVALDSACHAFIHGGRLRALVQKGEMTHERYGYLIDRGEALLKAAGLKPWEYRREPAMAPWSEWRLVFDGKEYPPKYPDYTAWLRHFHPNVVRGRVTRGSRSPFVERIIVDANWDIMTGEASPDFWEDFGNYDDFGDR